MDFYSWLQSANNPVKIVLDITILAFLIYKAYELLTKTQAVQLIKGAAFLAIFYGVAYLLRLQTLQWILSALAPGLFVAIAIIFQPELRQIFLRLGQQEFFRGNKNVRNIDFDAVLTAAEYLSKARRGALVIFPRRVNLKNIIETGTRIGAEITSSLIITVFEYDTPLHDGAMIVQNGKIIAAGCFLPLSKRQDIAKTFGTRHRAALGMSEESDALTLVVSEETGAISLTFEGKFYYDLSPDEAERKMRQIIEEDRGQSGGQNDGLS
ncbi:MAG: diadenylate cyclase CdaA [Spirochaetaceae bacterium]|jgi:diadenylate cyclase|nr:diadenylate cyclase CdaA [Spirochaetaceae bacterium]